MAATRHDRARLPDRDGWATDHDGVRVHWEVYGEGSSQTILLLPSAPIVHSRQWKGQVPYLARHARVVTFDGRGNGRSDRPTRVAAYEQARIVGDVRRVLDATGTERAVLVGLCGDGVWPAIQLAASEPDRVLGIVAFAVGVPLLSPPHPWQIAHSFEEALPRYDGWATINRHAWRRDYDGFLDFFFAQCFTEPHSTKPIEDCVRWAHETDPETLIRTDLASGIDDRPTVDALAARVRCPVLVIHGTQDAVVGFRHGARLHAIEGGGHIPLARDPVAVNLALRSFADSLPVRRP
jgi:pimeloyl-ACP methyl ester carboxylesterase